jgi:hypothetical protein
LTAACGLFDLLTARLDWPIQVSLWLPTPANLRLRRAIAALTQVVDGYIAAGRTRRPPGNDLLSTLIAAQHEDGTQMSDRQLRDEVMTLFSCADEDCTVDANLLVALNDRCGHVGPSRPQRAARIVRLVHKPTCELRGYRGYIAGLFVSTLTLAVLGLAVLFQTATRQFAAEPVPAQISTANPIVDRTVQSASLPLADPTQTAAENRPEPPCNGERKYRPFGRHYRGQA